MSDIALDRGLVLPDPFTEWYRQRPFQIAFAVSVLIHALLIALVPGLRSVQIETPQVLNVEIVIPEQPPPVVEPQRPSREPQPEIVRQPEFAPPVPEARPVERQVAPPEPVVEPVIAPPEPEAPPRVQRAELAPPVPQEAPRPEPIALPRPDPLPEQRIEIPVEPRPVPQVRPLVVAPPVAHVEPRPEPIALPRPDPLPEQRIEIPVEPRPVPQVRPLVVPPPVAHVEPRPEQVQPRIEPRPEPLPQPISEVPPPVAPVARPVPPSPPQARTVEPVIAPPPLQVPPPAPTVAVRAQPPVAAPAPPVPAPTAAVDGRIARELTAAYSQQISTQIKRYQKYPIVAQRRGWEGTAEVLLKIAADGRVTDIELGKSTGRDVLDREAVEMVRRASSRLPQAPQQLRGRELSVTVPIIFRLQDS